VEASAGTGKTYTIVGLYIRLLLEKKLGVDRILVMTFTNKATYELRDRIMRRLQECMVAIEAGADSDDPFFSEVISRFGGIKKGESLKLLNNAIQNFDDSRIFTIHGFCQKVLNEEALYAGIPFEMEVVQHDSLLLEAARDFWRDFVDQNGNDGAGRLKVAKLMKLGKTPRELIGPNGLKPLFSYAGADIEGDMHPDTSSVFDRAWELRQQLKDDWKKSRDDVMSELLKCGLKYYTEKNVRSRVQKMDEFLYDEKLKDDSFDQLRYFLTENVHDEVNLTQKNRRLPAKLRFFDLCSEYSAILDDLKRAESALIVNICQNILKRREQKSSQTGSMTYDDLIKKLRNALKDGNRGPSLQRKLLKNYPYALVDEFQDTDEIQYEIFDSIYPKSGDDSGLLMIGDPKQAIYAFRGADVYTYFRAKKEGEPPVWSLSNNYRSTPKLIKAVNRIFDSTGEQPFIEDQIAFQPSKSGLPERSGEYRIDTKDPVPLKFIVKKGLQTNKSHCKAEVYKQTVSQVLELLGYNKRLIRDKESGLMREMEPGDIAILINSHRDARQIKIGLKEVGVDSVTYSQEKVFDTFEASRFEWVMNAILNPFDRTAVNNALLSGLFGTDLERLATLSSDEEAFQGILDELQELHETWTEYGIMPVFRKLISRNGRMAEIAEWRDAERILINLHQLADMASLAELKHNLDPVSLHKWFVDEMQNPDKSDEQSLLLESDRELVKISTIHGSKGLEFPVVICPTLWEGKDFKEDYIRYHKGNAEELTLNVDRLESEQRQEAEKAGKIENLAEEARKAYVALTRAKYECRVIWLTHETSHLSGLGTILLGQEQLLTAMNESKIKEDSSLHEELFIKPMEKLADDHTELIAAQSFLPFNKSVRYRQIRKDSEELQRRRYQGREYIRVQQKVESFSSLAGHQPEPSQPDYDQITERYAGFLKSSDVQEKLNNIFGFPKGPVAGTAIHKIFEHRDFRFDLAETSDHSELVLDVLDEYGIEGKWMPVIQKMIRDVAGADFGDLKLASVTPQDELREMEFNFPISPANAEDLYSIIRDKNSIPLSNRKIHNYLTGFIDLIVRQNGKYYLLDYKSNYLGDNPEDYSSESLEREMLSAGYDLQYHLYTVALKKHLERKIPGFSYDEHMGGAFYCFVRGMEKESPHSIYFHKPDEQTILELEAMLEGK
jgi:exodeoxyribonuclease V beta subunit